MKRFRIFWVTGFLLAQVMAFSQSHGQDKLWVASEEARLKAERSASSETIATLALGTEVSVLSYESRWYQIRTPSGQEGWIYRGRLNDSPPATEEVPQNLFTGIAKSKIHAEGVDTARSIRGLTRETEQYARNRGTPAVYQEVLERVLALSVTEQELDAFLREGKIGEYAP